MLSIYAGSQINDVSTVKMARDAEVAKLGPTASARIGAIEQFYKATYGEADAKIKMQRLLTADDVRIAEREMGKALNPHGSTYRPSTEAPPDAGKVDEATYARMSSAERFAYAKQFSNGNGTRR
jgi:hypothetical protein